MGLIRDFWASRRARWQADALKATAEARLHERRAGLAAKPHKSASELMEQQLLESVGVGLLGGWGDHAGALQDYLAQLLDFSRGGLGAGAGLTNHANRRGGDWPWITSESHLAAHRDFSRLASPNPNIQGLLGGRRRYTIGTGATVRVKPRGDSPDAKDAAVKGQAFLDAFNKANRMPFRLRSFYDRASIDGEGIWRLFPRDDGMTDVRSVYSEQLRCPPGEDPEVYEYGILTDPDDREAVLEFAVFPLTTGAAEEDRVCPEEVVFYGRNRQDAVKRSLPDWTLATGEIAELADDLANNMGQGSALQAAIAFIRQHEGVPGESVRAFATADASYTKTDPYTGASVPVRKYPPGTVIDTNKNTAFLASPYNAGIDAHGNVFQLLVNRVSARWNAPKWLATSNSDEVNFASSLTAESPFVISTLEDQEYVTEPVRVVNERALAVAAAAGRLPRNILDLVEVEVTFPSPVARDRQAESAARSAELSDGYLSPQMAADQAGYEWAEVVKERAAATAQGWTPPSKGAAPGQPGQPGGSGGTPPPTAPTAPATESLSDRITETVRVALLEHGFTGTDRLGRKWVDGKEVPKDGGGTGTADPHPGRPTDAATWGEVHDALPDAVKADPGLVAKARKVASAVYETVWGFLAEHGAGLVPEILDTAEDFSAITYAKHGAQGQAVNDPFYAQTGVPYSVIAGIVSKGLAAAVTYFRDRRGATEGAEGLSDDERRQVAAAVAELFKRLWAALGVDVPAPTAGDVLRRMGERAQSAAG